MKNTRLTFLVLGFAYLVLAACGGGNENLIPERNPFPDPPEITPPPVVEAPPEPVKPVVPDLPKKRPLQLGTVYFDFDKSTLSQEARSVLADNARQLQDYPEKYIRVEGHCDERGTVEYNLALGERRAIAVRNYLVSFGISSGRITIISYGKERPIDLRHIPGAWDSNRRAEFVIL